MVEAELLLLDERVIPRRRPRPMTSPRRLHHPRNLHATFLIEVGLRLVEATTHPQLPPSRPLSCHTFPRRYHLDPPPRLTTPLRIRPTLQTNMTRRKRLIKRPMYHLHLPLIIAINLRFQLLLRRLQLSNHFIRLVTSGAHILRHRKALVLCSVNRSLVLAQK